MDGHKEETGAVKEKNLELVISTDIGSDIDDALAIYCWATDPRTDIKGVYVTNGPVDIRARVARKLLDFCGLDPTVGIGAAEALTHYFTMHTTFEGVVLDKDEHDMTLEDWEIEADGLDSMEKLVREGKTIACLAPLTDIARLLQRDPAIVQSAGKMYIMGGRENKKEHNFLHDTLAAQMVLDAGFDITIVPADVCDKYRLDVKKLISREDDDAAVLKFLSSMALAWKISLELFHVRMLENRLTNIHISNPEFFVPNQLKETLRAVGDPRIYQDDFENMARFYQYIFKGSLRLNEEPAYKIARRYMDEEIDVKGFKISDVFVAYATLHPDRTVRKRVTAEVDAQGIMTLHPGIAHEIVTDVDYEHFEEFVLGKL
ncbi:nucleoside hydrolase [Candidatus Woesearchaeota archaeon]|nr:nucleoside hydrolase [Candidatus Woesearchaeota archaeon]